MIADAANVYTRQGLNTLDLMWLAGLLEGEGSFTFTDDNPRVSLDMTDLDVVERAARLIDRPVRTAKLQPNRKQVYATAISGAAGIDLMRELLPHMGARRQARISDVVAAWYARIHTRRNGLAPRMREWLRTNRIRGELTPGAIAARLHVSPKTVCGLVRAGKIPHRRGARGRIFIDVHAVTEAA